MMWLILLIVALPLLVLALKIVLSDRMSAPPPDPEYVTLDGSLADDLKSLDPARLGPKGMLDRYDAIAADAYSQASTTDTPSATAALVSAIERELGAWDGDRPLELRSAARRLSLRARRGQP